MIDVRELTVYMGDFGPTDECVAHHMSITTSVLLSSSVHPPIECQRQVLFGMGVHAHISLVYAAWNLNSHESIYISIIWRWFQFRRERVKNNTGLLHNCLFLVYSRFQQMCVSSPFFAFGLIFGANVIL